jgi:hypothetical protein
LGFIKTKLDGRSTPDFKEEKIANKSTKKKKNKKNVKNKIK